MVGWRNQLIAKCLFYFFFFLQFFFHKFFVPWIFLYPIRLNMYIQTVGGTVSNILCLKWSFTVLMLHLLKINTQRQYLHNKRLMHMKDMDTLVPPNDALVKKIQTRFGGFVATKVFRLSSAWSILSPFYPKWPSVCSRWGIKWTDDCFTPKQTGSCFTPPPPSHGLVAILPQNKIYAHTLTSCFASQRSFLRKTKQNSAKHFSI